MQHERRRVRSFVAAVEIRRAAALVMAAAPAGTTQTVTIHVTCVANRTIGRRLIQPRVRRPVQKQAVRWRGAARGIGGKRPGAKQQGKRKEKTAHQDDSIFYNTLPPTDFFPRTNRFPLQI